MILLYPSKVVCGKYFYGMAMTKTAALQMLEGAMVVWQAGHVPQTRVPQVNCIRHDCRVSGLQNHKTSLQQRIESEKGQLPPHPVPVRLLRHD